MGLHLDMAKTLLLMVLTTCICTQAALRGKSSAVDFLNHRQREKRYTEVSAEVSVEVSAEVSAEDGDRDGDSEAEELLMARPDYYGGFNMQLNGGSQAGKNPTPGTEAVQEEGSGM